MSNKPRIAVVGAGIGGLTLALLLQRAAFTVHIFEAVESIRPLGVGINVQPSAVAELLALGLLEDLDRIGVRTQEVAYFNPQGQKVWGEARGRFAGYPVPQYSIHRGELQVLLLRAVQRRLGVDAVKLGHRVLEIDTDSTTIKVQHGSHVYRENSDIIIGADGIHSILRKQLYPAEGPPCFSGRMLWRATSMAKPFLTGASMAMVGHADQKFVTYPIAPVVKSSGLQCISSLTGCRPTHA
ncbi:MAG: FAD-dependent monooxygenase, partial [Burkholderiaceae bacterium]